MREAEAVDYVSTIEFFRPSHRTLLNADFADDRTRGAAITAVKDYVLGWEAADWLDENAIERRARWIGKTQPESVVEQLLEWAKEEDSAARRTFQRVSKPAEPHGVHARTVNDVERLFKTLLRHNSVTGHGATR